MARKKRAEPANDVAAFLIQRERILTHQVAAIRGEIERLELELADVRKAKASLEDAGLIRG